MTGAGAGPTIQGILETCLYAPNLAETARFYEEVLGLEAFSSSAGRHVFFRAGHGVFLLFDPRQTSAPGGEVPAHGASGPGHVAFAVPNEQLPLWRSRFAGHGTAIEMEIMWPGGGRSLYIRDPAGNSVELASPRIWSLPEADTLPQQ
jgi:catechol 2,3-dioxygenase-like lactoylglutathione lyase family enzyme